MTQNHMYPMLCCDKLKLQDNAKKILKYCKDRNIEMTAVVKGVSAWPDCCEALVDVGIKNLADSRILNIQKIQSLKAKKILLRIPMKSEISDVVKFVDTSLNSELEVLKLLNIEARKQRKKHGIILMVDVGDLREGILPKDVILYAKEIFELENIRFEGLGTNITCYGGVLPTHENLELLVECKEKIERECKKNIQIISGGNSSCFLYLINNNLPNEINNLRFGEVLLLGRETEQGSFIEELHQDVFKLYAEIVEIKEKPSVPMGRLGKDGFGNIPSFEDRGIRKRAIVALGRQDINFKTYTPTDPQINVLGASSDHMILDITDSKRYYNLGDLIEFNINYEGLLSLSTSEYVKKEMVNYD